MKPKKFLKFMRNFIHEPELHMYMDDEGSWCISTHKPTFDDKRNNWFHGKDSDADILWVTSSIKWDGEDHRNSLHSHYEQVYSKRDLKWIRTKG